MMKKCFITTVMFILFFLSSTAWAQIPRPARIGGTLTVDDTQITMENGAGYTFTVTRPDGNAFIPPAEDSDGIDDKDLYRIDIPIYDGNEQPGGARRGDPAIIHVYKDGSELVLESPAGGMLTVGDSGSLEVIDLVAAGANQAPTADAGSDQTVSSGDTVTLDGSGSSDPDSGDIITYRWRQIEGIRVTFEDDAVAHPFFIAPEVSSDGESLIFELVVTDSGELTGEDQVTITVVAGNTPPAADAGQDQTVTEGETVILDASGSADPDDGIVSYSWRQIAGTGVTLSDHTALQPEFTAPEVGPNAEPLTFELTVTDNSDLTGTDTVVITVTPRANQPPTANAGQDQAVTAGENVTLDASDSADPDDGITSYSWRQTDGTDVFLSDDAIAQPEFTAPEVGEDGESLVFELTVTDAGGLTATDSVSITVTPVNVNQPPVADAGPDQTVRKEDTVTLDGSASTDPDDGIASYLWHQTGGSSVTLSDDAAVQPVFTVPEGVDGESLAFGLTVTDNSGLTHTDTVIITVTSENLPPTADAGEDQTLGEGDIVTLDGSGSADSDDGIASFSWHQIGGDTVTLSDDTAITPTFTAPEVDLISKTLRFELVVTDNSGLADTDTVAITITPANLSPTADAGPGQTAKGGNIVILDGTRSSDPDDGIASYLWRQVSGIAVKLSSETVTQPAFTAPIISVDDDESLVFELTVTDAGGLTSTDSVTINIISENQPPVANAGPDQTVRQGDSVTLDGTGSGDPDDGIASYSWRQVGGATALLSDIASIKPVFTAPAVGASGESLVFELTVTDSIGLSHTDSVTINVTSNQSPAADAGSDQTIRQGDSVTLDGSGSSDPDDGIASYLWSQVTGTTVSISDTAAVKPVFTAPTVGESGESLVFELTVTDAGGLTATDSVTINIISGTQPVADAGPDQTVKQGDIVTLDGSGSGDPDDGIASYSWRQTGGATAEISDTASIKPVFTAPTVGVGESLVFELTVTDAGGLTATDSVTIHITSENHPPVANAGPNQTVRQEDIVTLDGSGSHDPDDGIASYSWRQAGGSVTAELSDTAAVKPVFTAPAVSMGGESLIFELVVTDASGLSHTDSVTIYVTSENQAPVADAGPDQTVIAGNTVTLNGSGSADPDGNIAVYLWRQIGGTGVLLSNNADINPTFTAPEAGLNGKSLIFELDITDDGGLTGTDHVTVNIISENKPPVAEAGQDQIVKEGDTVILDGTGSHDPDDGISSYLWHQISGTEVTLVNNTEAQLEFTAPGDSEPLVFELTVTDAGGVTHTDRVTVTINVSSENQAPVADAGPDQTVAEGDSVVLDGSGSDDDDKIVFYMWRQIEGTSVALSDTGMSQLTFVAPEVGSDGESLVFELETGDAQGLRDTDRVTVTVIPVNQPPVADAGPNQTAMETDLVMLNGSNSSDPDDMITSYSWYQISGTLVQLSDESAARPTFIAPEAGLNGESLTFELEVSDSGNLRDTDRVTINVTSANHPPRADAGPDQTVKQGDIVTLDGSNSSDPDNNITSYSWRQISGIPVTLSNDSAMQPTFMAPEADLNGESLTFELEVRDSWLQDADRVTINITSENRPPVADAGPDRIISEGCTVILSGSNSSDPENRILSYLWRQIDGPGVTISDPNTAQPFFIAPETGPDGKSLTFELKVKDTGGLEATDSVTLNVTYINQPPTADAGTVQTVNEGEVVMLDASGSADPDDGTVSCLWNQVSGPGVTLSDTTAERPTFTAPEISPGSEALTFRLTVTDSSGLKDTDRVTVNITTPASVNQVPTADAGSHQTMQEGNTVILDGSGSDDPDDGIMSYLWNQTGGDAVTLSYTADSQAVFVAPPVGAEGMTLVFKLTVTDRGGLQDTDETRVTVYDNGITNLPGDVITFKTATGRELGVKSNVGNITGLASVNLDTIPDRPENLIYGLTDLEIKMNTFGDIVAVTFYLPDPAPQKYKWYAYSPAYGWSDFSDKAGIGTDRNQIVLALTDGGTGDNDGAANGVIKGRFGLASISESPDSTPAPSSGGDGDSNSGCFVSASADGVSSCALHVVCCILCFAAIVLRILDRDTQISKHSDIYRP